MSASLDGLFLDDSTSVTRESFSRMRMGTWDSDSGFSDISLNTMDSTHSKGGSTSSTSTRSTAKRRAASPAPARSKAIRRVASDTDEDDEGMLHHGAQDLSTSLVKSYSHKQSGLELVVLRQPEGHHRARYQKEGSRGCIKDKTGNSCPALQLKGIVAPSILQIFVATETGKIRPHALYRACRVGGKRCTPARDHVIDSINVLELEVLPENNGIINIDCLGILKLRNADLEMHSEEESGKRRKREPKVRLVFRAVTKTSHGSVITLQTVSTPICCTPSPGMPEIHRSSHAESTAPGGLEIVIIGRNFLKEDSKFFVVERTDDGDTVWELEVPLQQEHFHHVHVVGTLPPYRDLLITKPVEVFLVVKNKQKVSEPYPFKYIPDESVMRSMTSPSNRPEKKQKPAESSQPHKISRSISHPTHHQPRQQQQQQRQQRASPVVEATRLMDRDGGGGTGNVLQYCIQPPGQNQPIFISFPQEAKVAVLEPTVDLLQKRPLSADFEVAQQMQAYLNGCSTAELNRMYEMTCTNMVESAGQRSDDDLLEQLLKDIMEPLS